jgi:hypothetical protein
MTLYLPTDEEALEGIGPWNDTPAATTPEHTCAGFLKCVKCGNYLLPCTETANGIHPAYNGCVRPGHPTVKRGVLAAFESDRRYANLLREHGRSTYALLAGSIGSTNVAGAQ